MFPTTTSRNAPLILAPIPILLKADPADAPTPAPFPDSSGGETASMQKPLVLVVDDAPDVTEMMAIMMRFAGYEVTTAFSAPSAFEAARQNHFDVAISDIGMPGMNGYQLAEALRALPGYEGVPLIAVTGFSMYDNRDRALRSGFSDFLTKPINATDLLNTVKRLLR